MWLGGTAGNVCAATCCHLSVAATLMRGVACKSVGSVLRNQHRGPPSASRHQILTAMHACCRLAWLALLLQPVAPCTSHTMHDSAACHLPYVPSPEVLPSPSCPPACCFYCLRTCSVACCAPPATPSSRSRCSSDPQGQEDSAGLCCCSGSLGYHAPAAGPLSSPAAADGLWRENSAV